ncbi:MAG: glycoside hydrolase family 127 protein [Butyrivibrio sp.]|nr:glycoside hydrolase family 127 protein [Butyrivibrio sp.]
MSDLDMVKRFKIEDFFFGRYERLVKDRVLPYQEKALNDMIEGAEKSHCIENFRMAAQMLREGRCDGEFYGMVFQDSDIAKWLEGAAYSLLMYPDAELEKRCDEVIELIGSTQHEDGYLNTYFTVKEPGRRWTNLCEAHELYCAGHMIEAAVAYAECTGKKRLLEIMCKMADHIYEHFIAEGAGGWSGHPEIELALMRLYRCTGEEKYKELALHFINVRGSEGDYFAKEREECQWTVWGNNPWDTEYNQSHAPVREQTKAVGHAVRAVYLYAGMAEAALESGDTTLADACKRLWDSITGCRMYITGAIGSAYEGEAFTEDYHLPNSSAYGETCAAIGLIFFAGRMLKLEHNAKYADVMERALYNCVLAGMELDGTKFFYVNPLEALPGISGKARSHPHTLPVRPKWFSCACCPPNVARLLPSVAEYAWTMDGGTVYSNLFIGGTLDLGDKLGGKVTVKSGLPYDGRVRYCFEGSLGGINMRLALRLPDWSGHTRIDKNGAPAEYSVQNGYAYIEGPFSDSDVIDVEFDMSAKRVYANANISDDSNKAAVSRGPLVYCAEGADNGGDVLSLCLSADGEIRAGEYLPDELCGIRKLYADGFKTVSSNGLYSYVRPKRVPCEITMVPYYAWANRGLNQMRVWLPEI